MLNLSSSQDIMYLAIALSVFCISAFLCWSLFEIGSLLHKLNKLVDDVQEKIVTAAQAMLDWKERISTSSNFLKVFSTGWKVLSGIIQERAAATNKKKSPFKRKHRDEEEEEADENE